MGSFYRLSLANLLFYEDKNHLDEFATVAFQQADRRETTDRDSGDVRRHVYATRVEVAIKRLDLLGYTLAQARAAFKSGLALVDDWEQEEWPIELKEDDGFDAWMSRMRGAIDTARSGQDGETFDAQDECQHFMLNWRSLDTRDLHILGFPSGDPRLVLRAALSASHPDDQLVLDLDDLVTAGWSDGDSSLWKISREPIIVVTEGKSDSRLLSRSLAVLHPELVEFISFIDFETANAKGGVDELVQFARMLIGCGIRNRLVVLFDNDTAGMDALDRLMVAALPENVFAMTLPFLPLAMDYPTLGPEGDGRGDINGKACALELYFGRDSLEVQGALSPIRWTAFNERMKRYQGQVCGKSLIIKQFEMKLDEVKKDPASVHNYDFSGIILIFQAVIGSVSRR